ncbi:MAG: excinuclease ABC subunit UvrC [Deltaproteobacteria bacterium]|nr:excinuclease ABC subunit UvrC [Deltaproteobacteria bacterium]
MSPSDRDQTETHTSVPDASADARDRLLAEASKLPKEPGVYLFRDEHGVILYIGKAKVLRNRVRTYFQRSDDGRFQVRFLVPKIRRIDTVVTRTEDEAIFLENTLIKKHRPRYNIELKDDKSHLVIRMDMQHPWPRAVPMRRPVRDGAKYFGPYGSAAVAREALDVLQRSFGLRTCSDSELERRTRPCIEHDIGRCTAPCVELISPEDYARRVKSVNLVLSGRGRTVLDGLRAEMDRAAEATDYEKAAKLRDQIRSIEETIEKHPVVSMDLVDRDVAGFYRDGPSGMIQMAFVRGGSLMETRSLPVEMHGFAPEEVLEQFLARYYGSESYAPEEILLPFEVEGADAISRVAARQRGGPVEVIVPQRGERAKLVELANRNAREALERRRAEDEKIREMLERLRQLLALSRLPEWIECYDISHLGGDSTAASRVVFHMGKPVRRLYRKYQIRTAEGGDDYGAMREVLARRLARVPGAGANPDDEWRLPDLMIVDGGKGQLAELVRAAGALGISSRPDAPDLAALAKSRVLERGRLSSGQSPDRSIDRSDERVFRPGDAEPRPLDPHSGEYRLLVHLRDESHRFAIQYQRKLREKLRFRSELDRIPGVGPSRRLRLLKAFGSIDGIRKASVEDLKAVEGVPATLARAVYEYFHPGEQSAR